MKAHAYNKREGPRGEGEGREKIVSPYIAIIKMGPSHAFQNGFLA